MNSLEEVGRSKKLRACHVCGKPIPKKQLRMKRLEYNGDGEFELRHIHLVCDRPESADEFPRRVAFQNDNGTKST